MPHTHELEVTARVLATDLQDVEAFEQERLGIYQDTAKEPDSRALALGDLVGRTLLKDGETTLFDETLDQATSPDEETATAAKQHLEAVSERVLKTVSKADKAAKLVAAKGYEIVLAEDGDVRDVRPIAFLNQSEKKNNASKRVSDQAPYGPKQNDSSIRISGTGRR